MASLANYYSSVEFELSVLKIKTRHATTEPLKFFFLPVMRLMLEIEREVVPGRLSNWIQGRRSYPALGTSKGDWLHVPHLLVQIP